MSSIYARADEAIKEMNRANLKAFNGLKLAKWDSLTVINQVGQVYSKSVTLAKRKYLEVAIEAYITALYELGVEPERAASMANRSIDADWILDMLEEVNFVTLYSFTKETERKKQRLIEAASVAQNKSKEIDKALRYWTLQVGQYADNSVFYARIKGFKDMDVQYVQWVTVLDGRQCEDCEELDGQVFRIEDVPGPQHYNCRCKLKPARKEDMKD